MIYDTILNAKRYFGLTENLDTALRFLACSDLSGLPDGRTEIDGDRVFANVMEAAAKDRAGAGFEIHKKYMDIQIDLSGTEIICIGLGEMKPLGAFSEETDFGTVACAASCECTMGPGRFIICMPFEPHMPGIVSGKNRNLRKCVIKVAK